MAREHERRLLDILDKLKNTTPGKWTVEWTWDHPTDLHDSKYVGYACGPEIECKTFKELHERAIADALFISEAREDMVYLLDVLHARESECKRLKELLRFQAGHVTGKLEDVGDIE